MNSKFLRYGAFAALVLMFSCQNDDSSVSDSQSQDGGIILNNDVQTLNKRIKFDNAGVLDLQPEFKFKNGEEQAGSLPLVLVAEVAAPIYNGVTLKATHVAINGNYAYVSYNTEGELYSGAIDVINISNPNAPQLVIQAMLPNTDISSVKYDNGMLYIAGARSVDAYPSAGTPAFAGAMTLSNGLLSTNLVQKSLDGNVGTSVTSSSSKYYAVSGNNGTLTQLSKSSNNIEMSISLNDLRALGLKDNKIVILSGTQGVKVYNADGLSLISSFSTSQDTQDAKRTIDFLNNSVLVSEGYNGLGVYNLSTGAKTQTIAVPSSIIGVSQSDITTNAVSVNNQNVFIANGGAGMYIYKNQNQVLNFLGSLSLNGSCNYVMSSGDYIFAAMGNGGLKIVKMVTTQTIDCTSFAAYTGSGWLNVNSGENLQYQGSASLYGVNVNANLTFCGSLSVSQGININSGGTFYMKGALAQGSTNNPWLSLNINNNAKLKVEGNVVIYGNVILNNGAAIEFIGNNSSITIYGQVIKNGTVSITGNYTDVNNKLN